MCRQEISVLLPLYSIREQAEDNSDEHRAIFDKIKMYNIRFSGAPRPVSVVFDLFNRYSYFS